MMTVSVLGGSNERTANNHWKGRSGRGLVWMIVGSGTPVGPKGPKKAAHAVTAKRTQAEKNMSFQIAAGTKGTPSLCVSSAYSFKYVSRRTTRPGIGQSLTPSVTTMRTCRVTNTI